MKNFFIFAMFMFASATALSKPVALSAPEMPGSQFNAITQSIDTTSYSEFIIQSLKKESEQKQLILLAAEFKKFELNQNTDGVFNICSQVYEIRHSADWESSDRNFIRICTQKLLILSADKRKQLSLQIETDAFSNKPLNEVSVPAHLNQNFNWVLINGKAFLLSDHLLEIPDTHFRATLVSNRYEEVTAVLNKEEFLRWAPQLKPILSGNCQNGFRYESRRLTGTDLQQAIAVAENCKMKVMSSHPVEKPFRTRAKKANFKIPKWAWWVAGSAVGLAIYQNNNKSKGEAPRQEPTSKRGF